MQPALEPRAEPAKARVGRRALWSYGLLTLLVLLPGIALKLLGPIVDAADVSPLRLSVQSALEPITFGSGLRFWVGVAGTTMMVLLLLYPLRKRLGLSRFAGSVGGWFHIHLALGLLGPALILYHANFGFGSFNANIALWSVGIVVASGFVALTLYLRASERMARARETSAESLDDILRILRPPGHHDLEGTRLIEDIRALHQRIEEHRSLLPKSAVRRDLKALAAESTRYVRDISLRAGALASEAEQLAASFRARLLNTAATARRAARTASIERAMRLWRLLHLPVIAVGAIATTLHVYAVWGVYDDPPPAAPIAVPMPAAPVPAPRPIAKATPTTTVERGIEIAGVRQAPFAAKPPVTSNEAASAGASREPELKQGPVPIVRSRSAETPPQPVKATEPAAAPAPASFTPPPPPPRPIAVPAKSPRPLDDGAAAVAELKRRNDASPTRVGELGGLTLAAKIAALKNSDFDHARTRFPLTGKHKRVACENCHIKTLIDTPRDCIACHKKDDVHRGRRPDCASCHTTNRWSEITRRR